MVTQSQALECVILKMEEPRVALWGGGATCADKPQGYLVRSLMFEAGGPWLLADHCLSGKADREERSVALSTGPALFLAV